MPSVKKIWVLPTFTKKNTIEIAHNGRFTLRRIIVNEKQLLSKRCYGTSYVETFYIEGNKCDLIIEKMHDGRYNYDLKINNQDYSVFWTNVRNNLIFWNVPFREQENRIGLNKVTRDLHLNGLRINYRNQFSEAGNGGSMIFQLAPGASGVIHYAPSNE